MSYAIEHRYQKKLQELRDIQRAMETRERDRISLVDAFTAARDGKRHQAARSADYSEALAIAYGLPDPGPHAFYIGARGLLALTGDDDGMMRRDLNTATMAAGGALAPAQVSNEIGDALRPVSVAARLGATFVEFSGGAVGMPRIGTASSATWLGGETAAATETQPALGQVAFVQKTVASYVEVSRNFAKQAGAAGERLLALDLLAVVGSALDAAVFQGSGASGQPLGLFNTSGVHSVSGTTFNRAAALEMQRRVGAANGIRNPSTIGYVAAPAIAETLAGRAVVASSDLSAWEGNLAEGIVAGALAVSTSNAPASSIAFGDWSQCVIATWGVLRVEVNPCANFPAGIIGARVFLDCDVGFRQPASFAIATSVT